MINASELPALTYAEYRNLIAALPTGYADEQLLALVNQARAGAGISAPLTIANFRSRLVLTLALYRDGTVGDLPDDVQLDFTDTEWEDFRPLVWSLITTLFQISLRLPVAATQ